MLQRLLVKSWQAAFVFNAAEKADSSHKKQAMGKSASLRLPAAGRIGMTAIHIFQQAAKACPLARLPHEAG